LITQGFTQNFGIDYNSTYSPIMGFITFLYLIGMVVNTILKMHLMDVVIVYQYGSLDANIYIKVSPSLKTTNQVVPIWGKHCGVKLQQALYDLIQFGHLLYQRLWEYFIEHHFINDPLDPMSLYKRRHILIF